MNELQKENQRLNSVNQKAQENFKQLVSVQSDVKAQHENKLFQLTEVHATYKRDLTKPLCFASHRLFGESFLSEEKINVR